MGDWKIENSKKCHSEINNIYTRDNMNKQKIKISITKRGSVKLSQWSHSSSWWSFGNNSILDFKKKFKSSFSRQRKKKTFKTFTDISKKHTYSSKQKSVIVEGGGLWGGGGGTQIHAKIHCDKNRISSVAH